ncbi:vitellogenin-A1-like [Ochlerotatus camptorhynchus]|uniref:vitellogenin-A1-like n=1 Tax=Ochlerotatus camptorhynchus TaxID=644619 RepID=UPI0031CE5C44
MIAKLLLLALVGLSAANQYKGYKNGFEGEYKKYPSEGYNNYPSEGYKNYPYEGGYGYKSYDDKNYYEGYSYKNGFEYGYQNAYYGAFYKHRQNITADLEFNAWMPNHEYIYNVTSKTMTAMPEMDEQWTGIYTRAYMVVRPKSPDYVVAYVKQPEYAVFNERLPQGYATNFNHENFKWIPMPMSSKPFGIRYHKGAIKGLYVEQDVPNNEVNIFKAWVSQLQVDTRGANIMHSSKPVHPNKGEWNGYYKVMEPLVTGECETHYDVNLVPQYLIQSHKQWVPQGQLRGDDDYFIQVIKTQNFDRCDQRMGYHFGFTGYSDFRPNTNSMGNVASKSLNSYMYLTGNWYNFTIQSSSMINKIAIAPSLMNKEHAMVYAQVNITLNDVHTYTKVPMGPAEDKKVFVDLVYSYNMPSDKKNSVRPGNSTESSSSSSESSSSSSSSSSESQEENPKVSPVEQYKAQLDEVEKRGNRNRRDLNAYKEKKYYEAYKMDQYRLSRKNDTSSDSSSSDDSSSSSSSSSESHEHRNNSSSDSSSSSSSSSSGSDSSSSESLSLSSEEFYYQPTPENFNHAPEAPFLPYFTGYKGYNIYYARNVDAIRSVSKLIDEIANDLQNPSTLPKSNTLSKFNIVTRAIRAMNYQEIYDLAQKYFVSQKERQAAQINDNKFSKRVDAWAAFRDAVAEAGTPPAYKMISQYIKEKKLRGHEAASVIATLVQSIRYPTEQLLHEFFLLVTSDVVQHQDNLNVTALISYSDFVNQAHVSNRSAYNYYPVFSFGRLADADYKIIEHKLVPWLAHHLREAVHHEDSVKIQVYIRTLGNLGHPQILSVFEPYLEGKIQITDYQRLAMIVALDKLVVYYPELARSVLFRAYQNIGDVHEIRCAAVHMLMRTDPSAEILQRMAEFTHHDPSRYVRAAVKSAIETATQADEYDNYSRLAVNAKAAANFLFPEDFSTQYSFNHIRDYALENLEMTYRLHYGEIASGDHYYPNGLFYHLRQNFGGFKKYTTFYYLVSSMEAFFDVFDQQYNTKHFEDYYKSSDYNTNFYNYDKYSKYYKQYYNNKDSEYYEKYYGKSKDSAYSDKEPPKYTAARIAKLLNIDSEEAQQLEGQLMFKLFNGYFFQAFDNKTIENLPRKLKHFCHDLEDGYNFDLTKFYQQQDVVLAWPLATGFQFLYTLKTPTVVKFELDATAKTHPQVYKQPAGHPENENDDFFYIPQALNASVGVKVLYHRMVDAKVGFITPFNHQRHIAGYQKKLQGYLPLNVELSLDFVKDEFEFGFEIQDPKEDHLLFHMSSWPYTGFKDITDMRPIAESPNAKIVHDEDQTTKTLDYTFGQDMTGVALRFHAKYDNDFINFQHFWNLFKKHDFVSAVNYPFAYQPYHYHQFNLYYDAQRTHAKSFKFFAYHKFGAPAFEETGPKHPANRHSYSGNYYESNFAQPFVYSAGSQRRYEQFFHNAASGIRNSFVRYYDFGFEFYAPQQKSEFVFTTAFADSPVDKTSRQLFYFYASPMFASQSYFKDIPFNGKQFQFCGTAVSEFPRVPYLKFSDFDQYYGDANQYFDFLYGESCQGGAHISVKGKQKQTGKYREYLRFSDVAKTCKEQMADGYYQFEECQQAIDQAYYYDFYDYAFEYKDVGPVAKNISTKFYDYFQYAFYPYFESNFFYHGKHNQIKAEFEFAPYGDYYNASFYGPSYAFQVQNYPIENDYSTYFPYFFKYTFFPKYYPYFLHRLPSHKEQDRQYNELSNYEQFAVFDRKPQYPSCSFSTDYFYTFDDKKYFYDMGDCWHVVLHTVKPDYDFYAQDSHFYNSDFEYKYKNGFEEYEQFSALARRGSDKQLYFKFLFGDNYIDVFPNNGGVPFVYFNGRPYDVSQHNIAHFEAKEGYASFPFFYAFAYPNKDVEFSFFGGKLKFATDGYRARFFSDYSYYNNFVGLCGTNNGEYSDDFVTPDQCYMRKPEFFAASYALTGQNCTGPAKAFNFAYQQKAKEECIKKEVYYGNIIYEQEFYRQRYRYYNHNVDELSSSSSSSSSSDSSSSSSESNSNDNSSSSSSSSEEHKEYNANQQQHTLKDCPVQHQHQFFQQGDQICFTLRPLPACHSKCAPTDKISKYFDVQCFEKNSSQAQQYKSEISRGYNPDFKSFSSTKTFKFNYPKSCVYKAY